MRTYITDFIPWGKTYCFNMDRHDCYYRKYRQCSLNKYEISLSGQKELNCSSPAFCLNLAGSLLENGFIQTADDVLVHKKECGHYEISQGQHRVCICARLQMPMKVLYQEDYEKCVICCLSHKNWRKKISYLLWKEHEFLMRL